MLQSMSRNAWALQTAHWLKFVAQHHAGVDICKCSFKCRPGNFQHGFIFQGSAPYNNRTGRFSICQGSLSFSARIFRFTRVADRCRVRAYLSQVAGTWTSCLCGADGISQSCFLHYNPAFRDTKHHMGPNADQANCWCPPFGLMSAI